MRQLKKISFLLLGLSIIFLASCEKFTDITPKGANLLNTVTDLDYLLNYNWVGSSFNLEDLYVVDNDMYPLITNVPNLLSEPTKGLPYAMVTWDESIDRVDLTVSDVKYERLYPIIANVANIVLANADEATGDRTKANKLKAEAYVIRAYLHYLLVNIYAKAYDPATADTDGGIPYINYIDYDNPSPKNTVGEVYENILSDLDAAFALNSLPDQPVNSMRVGKGFAYSVKAWVLLSMRDYSGALEAAEEALNYNSELEDHRPFLTEADGGLGLPVSRTGFTAPDNIFYSAYINSRPYILIPSLEITNDYYEPGNIIFNYTTVYNSMYGTVFSGLAGTYCWFTSKYQMNASGIITSDLYMIKAECLARTSKISEAMDVINYVRERRIRPADYVPLTATSEAEAMAHLMKTSRIEFLFTYKNFINIKRWNAEGTYAQTITRNVNGTTYELTPGSDLWIFPFPQSATNHNPNLTQNY